METIRILIVDTSNDFFFSSAKDMEKEGILSVPARSTKEALKVLEDDPIDVMVLNDSVSDITELQTIRDLKDKYPQIEIILLTKDTTLQDAIRGIKHGVFDYEEKPADLKQLIFKIKLAYEQRKIDEAHRREEIYRIRAEQQGATAERLTSLGTLAAGVAHEINNPLAIIQESTGWLRMLLEKDEGEKFSDKKEFIDTVDIIEKSVERAKTITHQLMQVIRKTDAKIAQVDLNELLDETLKLNQKRISEWNIEIVKKIDKPPVLIWCDPQLLRQILTNLVMNACESITQKGKVIIGLRQFDDSVILEIKDTGEGIAKENLERIFEPFFTTKSTGRGTGLGLYVTKGIIDNLGGVIHVESDIGQGTRVKVKLPKFCKLREDFIRDDFTEPLSKLLNQNPLKR